MNRVFGIGMLYKVIQLKTTMEQIIMPITQKYGLTPMGAFVLLFVSYQDDLTVGNVYKLLNFNQGNMSSMCKRLESKGYLQKKRRKDDERKVSLEMTEKGMEIVNRLKEETASFDKMIQGIPVQEMEAACQGFEKFVDIIQQFQSEILTERKNISC